MMKKATKNRWIKALRSGEYEQGKIHLRDERDQFCCLGVLVDVELEGEWRADAGDHGDYTVYLEGKFQDLELDVALTQEVREHVGLTLSEHVHLIKMNDGLDKSFDEIADWIERKL